MREKVVFCWPKVVICMKPLRQKVEQCEGKVEQTILLLHLDKPNHLKSLAKMLESDKVEK